MRSRYVPGIGLTGSEPPAAFCHRFGCWWQFSGRCRAILGSAGTCREVTVPSCTDLSVRKEDTTAIDKVSHYYPPSPMYRDDLSPDCSPCLPFVQEPASGRIPVGCDKMQILKDKSLKEKLSGDIFRRAAGCARAFAGLGAGNNLPSPGICRG